MVGFTLQGDEDYDRHSVHSIASTVGTVCTTTSLASRIRDLNLDFGDKLQEEAEEEEPKEGDRGVALQSPLPEDSEQEDHSDAAAAGPGVEPGAAEEDLGIGHTLHLLRDPPLQLQPLQVCCRLFERRSHPPLPLKRMSMAQVEDFRQHGYVVLDNLLSKEAAARIKAEALRLTQQGQFQPINSANLGVLCSAQAAAVSSSQQQVCLSSSPCSSTSSHGMCAGYANGTICSSIGSRSVSTPADQQRHQHLQQQAACQQLQQQPPLQQHHQQHQWGELRMPLLLGRPPADTAVFAPLMAALQELQEDLSEFVRLRSKGSAEYCLCQLPAGSLPVPRHRDAVPDDGRRESSIPAAAATAAAASGAACCAAGCQPQQQQQRSNCPNAATPTSPLAAAATAAAARSCCNCSTSSSSDTAAAGTCCHGPPLWRVSIFAFVNPDWDKDSGGVVRLWPPQRPVGPPSATAASAAARRSPTSSDAGTTFSEISDCGSLRVAFLGSTTSSVIAEASAPDHDTYSLDGISVADSEAERQGFEWLECEGGEMALDIAPLAGRVLLVLSGAVEHALLPGSGSSSAADMVFARAWCR